LNSKQFTDSKKNKTMADQACTGYR